MYLSQSQSGYSVCMAYMNNWIELTKHWTLPGHQQPDQVLQTELKWEPPQSNLLILLLTKVACLWLVLFIEINAPLTAWGQPWLLLVHHKLQRLGTSWSGGHFGAKVTLQSAKLVAWSLIQCGIRYIAIAYFCKVLCEPIAHFSTFLFLPYANQTFKHRPRTFPALKIL